MTHKTDYSLPLRIRWTGGVLHAASRIFLFSFLLRSPAAYFAPLAAPLCLPPPCLHHGMCQQVGTRALPTMVARERHNGVSPLHSLPRGVKVTQRLLSLLRDLRVDADFNHNKLPATLASPLFPPAHIRPCSAVPHVRMDPLGLFACLCIACERVPGTHGWTTQTRISDTVIAKSSWGGEGVCVDGQQRTRAGWAEEEGGEVRHDGSRVDLDVLLRDVDTCYSNVEVALRRNEMDQVRTLISV